MRNFILIVLTSIQVMAQESLPFSIIPPAPDEVTAASTLARMVQGLGFRYYWATEGLTLKDLNYRPTEEAQSTLETLQHIYGLALVIKNTTENSPNTRPLTGIPDRYEELRKATLTTLSEASEKLIEATEEQVSHMSIIFDRKGKISNFPIWNLMNGPLEDAIYHTGQIVSFRRTAGNPIPKGVNVFLGVKN
ncbi:MAG: hypothetical protein MUR17_07120 [Flavobacteriaceae bacterium]|nr:hypothetical protein [Flavobacteriaceae bacterium]